MSVVDVGVEGEAGGARARACVTLTPEASTVWNAFSRAEKIRVASIFSELVLYYSRTRRLPAASIDIVLQAADVIKGAYEVCLKEKDTLGRDVERLRGEVEELRGRLAGEAALKAEVEALQAKLNQAQEEAKHLRGARETLKRELEVAKKRLQRLKFICQARETLEKLATTAWEKLELEALCTEPPQQPAGQPQQPSMG